VGKISPAIIFNIVDLPVPDGPTIANLSPELTNKLIFLSTLRFPQSIERSLASIAGTVLFKIKNFIK